MHRFLTISAFSLFALRASAICTPPYQVVFACDIEYSSRQVEVCEVPYEVETGSMARYTFNSALWNQPSDIFIETNSAADSTYKHYSAKKFNGVAFEDGGRLYTIYASGSFQTDAMYDGMVEVFDSQEDFNSASLDQQAERWECADGTLRGNFSFFAP